MVSISFRVVFTAAMSLFLTASVLGWDDTGHRITGFIAWQRLTPQARENVIRILRSAPEDSDLATYYMASGPESEELRKLEYFMLVPTWADIIRERSFQTRYRKYHKSNWHYDDTFWRQVNAKVEVLSGFEEGGVAVAKLNEFDSVIRNASATSADKAIAIAWIMHLTGDMHQPLHTSARVTDTEPKGDQGGNLFLLTPQGTARENQVNLHWFWDSIVGRNIPIKNGMCDREYIEMVAKRMMKKHPFSAMASRLNLGKYGDWQQESFAYNNTVVFSPDLQRNQMPSDRYRKNAFKLAEQQLALAGYRLGETLNAALNVPEPPNR